MTHRLWLGAATIRPEPAPTVNRTQETTVTDQPAPIRKSDLPATPPAEWEFHTWFPHPDGGGDMVPGERQRGVLVRRRVSHGDWEPVRPDHWAAESPTDVAPAVVSAPVPPADQTALRDRIAEKLTPYFMNFSDEDAARGNAGEAADAVLAVLPAGRAAVLGHLADQQTQLAVADDLARRRDKAAARRELVKELRRLAAEARGAQQDEAAPDGQGA